MPEMDASQPYDSGYEDASRLPQKGLSSLSESSQHKVIPLALKSVVIKPRFGY
jgi:hypothetical protein